jgi:GTP:adenosylcobinamide-phosphate guanylyltransferase
MMIGIQLRTPDEMIKEIGINFDKNSDFNYAISHIPSPIKIISNMFDIPNFKNNTINEFDSEKEGVTLTSCLSNKDNPFIIHFNKLRSDEEADIVQSCKVYELNEIDNIPLTREQFKNKRIEIIDHYAKVKENISHIKDLTRSEIIQRFKEYLKKKLNKKINKKDKNDVFNIIYKEAVRGIDGNYNNNFSNIETKFLAMNDVCDKIFKINK